MEITRTSIMSGKTRTMDLNITEEQYNNWVLNRPLIHTAFPNLSADDREFILTGITKEEWDSLFLEDSD